MSYFLNFLKYLMPFSLVLWLGQYFIIKNVFYETSFFYSSWSIYVFHIISTSLTFLFLVYVNTAFSDKTGFTFMGMNFIKMMASIIFLLPLIQSNVEDKIPDVAIFFIPYFLYLFFETVFTIRLINK